MTSETIQFRTPGEYGYSEHEILQRIAELAEQYCPEDREFVIEMDVDDAIKFLFGRLEASGEDAEAILIECGIIAIEGDKL